MTCDTKTAGQERIYPWQAKMLRRRIPITSSKVIVEQTLWYKLAFSTVFPPSEGSHILSATFNNQLVHMIVVDEMDFEQLVQAIGRHGCWKEAQGYCEVRIEEYRPQKVIRVEHQTSMLNI